MKILFVCSGNACRSILTEYLAKEYGVEVSSAGVSPASNIYGVLKIEQG